MASIQCSQVTRGRIRQFAEQITDLFFSTFQAPPGATLAEQSTQLQWEQKIEMDLEVKAPHGGFIQVVQAVGGGDEHSLEPLHLRQHFIDKADLPALPSVVARLQKTVNLIHEQHRALFSGLLERLGNLPFRFPNVGTKQV